MDSGLPFIPPEPFRSISPSFRPQQSGAPETIVRLRRSTMDSGAALFRSSSGIIVQCDRKMPLPIRRPGRQAMDGDRGAADKTPPTFASVQAAVPCN
jgi:hypothetical protein